MRRCAGDLEEQLAETEKLRALGQLTGGVAHDFNNLMTVVSSAAEMLQDEPDMDIEEHAELVEAIRKAADTGRTINAGLLAYARKQKLTPELIDLEEHLSNSRPLFQGTVGEEMGLQIKARPLTITADKGQLTTAIINLLSNARDASESRGTVSIDVESLPDESAVKLSVKDSVAYMVLSGSPEDDWRSTVNPAKAPSSASFSPQQVIDQQAAAMLLLPLLISNFVCYWSMTTMPFATWSGGCWRIWAMKSTPLQEGKPRWKNWTRSFQTC
ncbi:MAG: hypothetical protein GY949_14010 [Gammaproteobacteria bacterium]|nr:hypothetical protein [Gammaproteobacteria bacterium]